MGQDFVTKIITRLRTPSSRSRKPSSNVNEAYATSSEPSNLFISESKLIDLCCYIVTNDTHNVRKWFKEVGTETEVVDASVTFSALQRAIMDLNVRETGYTLRGSCRNEETLGYLLNTAMAGVLQNFATVIVNEYQERLWFRKRHQEDMVKLAFVKKSRSKRLWSKKTESTSSDEVNTNLIMMELSQLTPLILAILCSNTCGMEMVKLLMELSGSRSNGVEGKHYLFIAYLLRENMGNQESLMEIVEYLTTSEHQPKLDEYTLLDRSFFDYLFQWNVSPMLHYFFDSTTLFDAFLPIPEPTKSLSASLRSLRSRTKSSPTPSHSRANSTRPNTLNDYHNYQSRLESLGTAIHACKDMEFLSKFFSRYQHLLLTPFTFRMFPKITVMHLAVRQLRHDFLSHVFESLIDSSSSITGKKIFEARDYLDQTILQTSITLMNGFYFPFHQSASGAMKDILRVQELLLSQPDCDVHILDKNGRHPLTMVLNRRNDDGVLEAVQQLVRAGANPNCCGDDGNGNTSPLHMAVLYEHIPVVEYLLSIGCDANANANNNGKKLQQSTRSPLEYAMYANRAELMQLLIRYGANKPCKAVMKEFVEYITEHESVLGTAPNSPTTGEDGAEVLLGDNNHANDDNENDNDDANANDDRVVSKIYIDEIVGILDSTPRGVPSLKALAMRSIWNASGGKQGLDKRGDGDMWDHLKAIHL